MTRHEEREQIISLLYEYTYYEGAAPNDFISSREEMNETVYPKFVKEAFLGVSSAKEQIDRDIAAHSVGWKVNRMSRITRSILRLAVYEMNFTETPPKVVINEALELAKAYDDGKAPGFINGILNNFARAEGKIKNFDDANE